jgi:TPR repeat protein
VKKSVRLGLKWLEKAAAQDFAESLIYLGLLYRHGRHVVQEEERACRYFRRAAELGSAGGQFQLGEMLMFGRGTAQDQLRALDMLDQSCEQGFEPALRIRAHLDEFMRFDPTEAGLKDFPVKHPFPLRRRTCVYVTALDRPCFQAMARDIYDYVRENPGDKEAGLKDVAVLLAAAAEQGEPLLPFVGS